MATLENLLSPAIVGRLGWTLIHFVWQAAAVALLLALVLKALRQRSASLRYIVACLALMLIVALPLVTMALVEVAEPVAEAGPVPVPLPIMETTPMEVIEVAELPAMSIDAAPLEMADAAVRVPWTQRAATALEPALPYLVLGWLLGVFGLSAWHLGGWAQLQRMKRRMVCDVAAPLRTQLAALSERLGVSRAVGLLESALVEVPTVVGWIKPVVLLPASALSGLSAEQLEAILAHELAHVRRYDYLVNIAQTVIEILGFYHPALWWISHKIRAERENCCDDLAVQVCGDSVRYARALTCLEEMRHHHSELAVAASGGSLVARIGRLLGRPTTDNRRFTWLPGLIALLLVAAAIIPTALVLAAPESLPGNASPVEQQGETTEPQTPRQVVLSIILGEFSPDETLDRDTATRARNLLADATRGAQFQVPSVEELQGPLWQVLKEYVADPNVPGATAKALADLLISTGRVDILGTPDLLMREGRSARLVVGGDPSLDIAAASDGTDQFRASFEITPTVKEDSDTIQFSMKISGENVRSRNLRDDRPMEIGTFTVNYEGILRNDVYRLFPFSSVICPERADLDEETGVFLLLVKPSVTGPAMNDTATEPTTVYIPLNPPDNSPPLNSGGIGGKPAAEVKVLSQTEAEGQSEPRILIDCMFAKVFAGKALDRETMLLVGDVLAGEPAGFDSESNMTLGEVLRASVVGKPLAPATLEALVALLESRGYLEVEASPQVLDYNNRQSQINVTTEEPVLLADDPTGSPEYIELGVSVQATPHFSPEAADRITLEIAAEWTELVGELPAGGLPTVARTEMASTVTLPRDHFFAFLMGPDDAGSTLQTDRESKLILFRADCVEPSAQRQSASVPQSDGYPRQVLLDVQIVEMASGNLTDLGLEWGSPQISYAPDQAYTASVHAALRRLCSEGRARLLSQPHVATLDGRQARFVISTEQRYTLHAPATADQPQPKTERVTVTSGTILSATPTINASGDITLEIAVECSDSIPSEASEGLPVITRRTSRNVVTVKDGGTVALAGLSGQDADAEQIAIFVTVSLAPENNPPARPDETSVSLPPTVRIDREIDRLREHLEEPVTLVPQAYEDVDPITQLMLEHIYGLERELTIPLPETEFVLPSTGRTPSDEPRAALVDPEAKRLRERMILARQEYVDADPYLQELARNIVAMERDLIVARQTLASESPVLIQKEELLDTFKNVLEEKRQELEEEFDTGLIERLEQRRQRLEREPSQQEMILVRQEYVNSDPMVQELAKSIAEMERELIVARQTLASESPVVIQKETLLETFKNALAEKRQELEEEFDAGLIERLEQRRQQLERESSQHPAGDAQTMAEFVNNDPMVRTLTQTIAEMEIDLIVAQRQLLPENPEIVQKKQLLQAFNRRLARRRQELERQYDTGAIPTVTPDAPAQQGANGEKVLEIMREELARVEEEIRETRRAWRPEENEATRARRLAKLRQYQSTVERQYEEIAGILDEQVVAPDESETKSSSSSMVAERTERTRFVHTDANGQIDREFGFEELIHSEDDRWIVANPYLRLFVGDVRCHITADGGWTRLETGTGLAPPVPGDTAFSANVKIEIAPDEPNGTGTCVLYADELTYDAKQGTLSCAGPVRVVCGGTEFIGRGLDLYDGPAPTRPSGDHIKTVEGIDLYLSPASSFVITLGHRPPEPAVPSASAEMRALTEAPDDNASSVDDKTQITLDLPLLKITTDRPLTAEAAARLSRLWDQMVAKRETEGAGQAALPSVEELRVPPAQLLERCAKDGQADSEALQIMTDLLVSLEYVQVVMNPRVKVYNGKQAEIKSTQHVPHPETTEMVECGTALKVTPRAQDGDRITLDMAIQITDLAVGADESQPPEIIEIDVSHKQTMDSDKTLVLRLEPTTEGEAQDSDILYLLVRPRVAPPEPVPGPVTATFQGVDLREALLEVGEQAGANIICDANVSGEVYAELRGVTLETALRTILGGSPFIVQVKPHAYLITDRGTQTANLDLAPARVYSPVAATFSGMDLDLALEEVAAMAGANLMYDADLSGQVWARLQDIPLEKALETILVGSPYIARRMPTGYAITRREEPPAEPASREEDAVSVEARYVLLDKALMEALQRGLPIEGVETPEDVNALHAIGADLLADETPLLEPTQVALLLQAVSRYADSKSLAAPKVTVLDGESASFRITEPLDYVGGYREPNDASGGPVPVRKSEHIGVAFDVTPRLIENDNVRVAFEMEIESLLEMQTAMYQGTYKYDIPSFETVTIETEIVIPDGQTALIDGGKIRSLNSTQPSKDQPARPMIILIKPRKTEISPVPSAPLIPGEAPIGAGGGMIGAFQPGASPLDPTEIESMMKLMGVGQGGMGGFPPGEAPPRQTERVDR